MTDTITHRKSTEDFKDEEEEDEEEEDEEEDEEEERCSRCDPERDFIPSRHVCTSRKW